MPKPIALGPHSSVQGWAAEIVVILQQDVSDGTEELARARGAIVVREP